MLKLLISQLELKKMNFQLNGYINAYVVSVLGDLFFIQLNLYVGVTPLVTDDREPVTLAQEAYDVAGLPNECASPM